MTPKIIKNSMVINASSEKVWNALTNPEETKKYMYGCETVSTWRVGDELLWRGELHGKQVIFVKGYILSIDPPHVLMYTVFDPNNAAIEDLPENYLLVTYFLEPHDGGTLLTVTQGDYNSVADGERRYAEAYNNGEGWNPILLAIKQQVEAAN